MFLSVQVAEAALQERPPYCGEVTNKQSVVVITDGSLSVRGDGPSFPLLGSHVYGATGTLLDGSPLSPFVRVDFTSGVDGWVHKSGITIIGCVREGGETATSSVEYLPRKYKWVLPSTFSGSSGIETDAQKNITSFDGGDWIRYDAVDFGNRAPGSIAVQAAVPVEQAGKYIEFRIDDLRGPVIAVLKTEATSGATTYTEQYVGMRPVEGVHTLYVRGVGEGTIAQIRGIHVFQSNTLYGNVHEEQVSSGRTFTKGLVLRGEEKQRFSGIRVSNPDGACIVLDRVTRIEIEDAEIGPCKGPAVEVRNALSVGLENLHINNARAGILVASSSDVHIERISLSGTSPMEYGVILDRTHGGSLMRSMFSGTYKGDMVSLISSEYIDVVKNVFRHYTFTSPTFSPFVIGGHQGMYPGSDYFISGNNVTSVFSGSPVFLTGSIGNTTLLDNTFTRGMYIYPTGAPLQGVVMRNNIIGPDSWIEPTSVMSIHGIEKNIFQ